MDQKKQERLIAAGLIAVLVLLLIPMFLIGKYNFISMDDYTYGNIVRGSMTEGKSFFGVLWAQAGNAYDCYMTWQGQYFVNWLIMVFLALRCGHLYNGLRSQPDFLGSYGKSVVCGTKQQMAEYFFDHYFIAFVSVSWGK